MMKIEEAILEEMKKHTILLARICEVLDDEQEGVSPYTSLEDQPIQSRGMEEPAGLSIDARAIMQDVSE